MAESPQRRFTKPVSEGGAIGMGACIDAASVMGFGAEHSVIAEALAEIYRRVNVRLVAGG